MTDWLSQYSALFFAALIAFITVVFTLLTFTRVIGNGGRRDEQNRCGKRNRGNDERTGDEMTMQEAQDKYDEACRAWHKAVDYMHTPGNWLNGCVAESYAAMRMSDAAGALEAAKRDAANASST